MRGRLSMPTSVSAGTGEICMTISCVCLYDNPIVEPKGPRGQAGGPCGRHVGDREPLRRGARYVNWEC
jgi:hypothetical protein